MFKLKQKFKYSVMGMLFILVIFALLVFATNWYIESYSEKFVFDHPQDLPHNKVGLILGTSKRLADGRENLYFKYRIEAAVNLFKAKKIDFILVSGDNGKAYYNEPIDMKKALLTRGIPDSLIYLDYAGFRTLDSVIRGFKVFGQDKITIISQEFHNKRAIYIAQCRGIQAIGYNARDVHYSTGFKTQLREKFARLMVFVDLFFLNTQPKFLGDKIQIGAKTMNN